jgi:UDP-GlcNAc:undecaprenyl-phosphate/decaprenyl-phosphate GlcNAc-1-phosphate transferase
MSEVLFVPFGVLLFLVELGYFRLANYFKILDKPNERSLHLKPIIRGGGIVFPIAVTLYIIFINHSLLLFLAGLIAVSVIGFLDDVRSLSSSFRFLVQSAAIGLMMYSLNISHQNYWWMVITFVIVTGALNAYNFMDGINGLTGGYSLVIASSLFCVNSFVIHFADSNLILTLIISLMVFNYFNFRTKAICFAGDVGSMACGFIIIYLLLDLIHTSQNYIYITFLAVYGVDSVLTIVHRLLLKQNIFKPHRMHLYQELISKIKINHLQMTSIYMTIQMLICVLVISNIKQTLINQYIMGLGTLISLGVIYIFLKIKILKIT